MPAVSAPPSEIRVRLPRHHPGQVRLTQVRKRFTVVPCGRRYGKTTYGIGEICETALEGWPTGWFAPSYRLQAEAWRDLKRYLEPATRAKNDSEHRLELWTGGTVEAWTVHNNPDAGRSRKYKRIVGDEAAYFPDLEQWWEQAGRATLADYEGDAMFLSSPRGTDSYFYELYRRGLSDDPLWQDWAAHKAPSWDNPHIPQSEIDEARATLHPLVFDQEWGAEFVDLSDIGFLQADEWDHCLDTSLPPLLPGAPEAVVLALDAGVSNDNFAVVAVTRNPKRHQDPAIRAVRVWVPPQGGRIDFDAVDRWVRTACLGGCPMYHPVTDLRPDDCDGCRGTVRLAPLNVVKIVYDPYQLEDMAQRLRRDRVAAVREFGQGSDRLEADSNLRRLVIAGVLAHNGDEILRVHILNAAAKVQTNEESKVRIVKRAPERKVDAAVAASMGVYECQRLNL